MRFIITAQPGEHGKHGQGDGAFDEKLFADYMKFNEEMYRAGVLVASEGLNVAGGGARIEVKKGQTRRRRRPVRRSPRNWWAVSTSSRWARSKRRSSGRCAARPGSASTMCWRFER